MQPKNFIRVALGAAAILLIPLIAMLFTSEVNWTGSDFAIAWVLLTAAGLGLTMLVDKNRVKSIRVAGAVIIVVMAWLWVELAVGLFTNWGS